MDVHPVFYRNTNTILPQSLSHSLSYFLFILNVSVSLYFCWTFLRVSSLCFKSSLVVNGPFNLRFLKLLRKRLIQLNTLNVLRSENFDNSLSNMFSVVNVVTRISLIFFFSISDPRNFQFLVVVIVFDLRAIWDLPTIYYQYFTTSTPRSAGFSFVGTYLHAIKLLRLILDILLLTNVLYSPLPFNQSRTEELSDHAYIFLTISLLRQILTFSARFPVICAATNARHGIEKFLLANLDLLVTKFWRNTFCWFTTAYYDMLQYKLQLNL